MANKFKDIEQEEEEQVVEPTPVQKKKSTGKGGLFKSLSALFGGGFLSATIVVAYIPFVLFLSGLAIFYISYNYWADDKLRQQNKITLQLKELRSEYIASKSDLMFISKQTEVAKAVESMGLKEPIVPPMKILVQADTVNQK